MTTVGTPREGVRRAPPDGPEATGGTRARLVSVASELLAQGGPDAVTLREVGRRAGVSRTAPYRHFQDKHDLLAAVAAEGFGSLRADMEAAMAAPGGDPEGDALPPALALLHRGCVAYVRAGLARPEHYRLMFREKLGDRPDPHLAAVAGDGALFFLGTLEQCQRAGVIRAGDVRDVAAVLWSTLHGMVELALAGHLHADKIVDVRTAAPRLIAQLLTALGP